MYKQYNVGYGIIEYLRPWDGTTPESWHKYPTENSAHPLLVNADGDIYYISGDGRICVWCSRDRLRGHLHKLYQAGVIA